jgi:uncharacterized membrane protein YphA (DoxX/SURF4 family)
MTKSTPYLFLRTSFAAVVLYFAITQLVNPEPWALYIPEFFIQYIDPIILVLLNGLGELLLGLLLLVGIFTRWAAWLLAIHIFLIALSIGFNPTGIRDIGLAAALAYIGMLER